MNEQYYAIQLTTEGSNGTQQLFSRTKGGLRSIFTKDAVDSIKDIKVWDKLKNLQKRKKVLFPEQFREIVEGTIICPYLTDADLYDAGVVSIVNVKMVEVCPEPGDFVVSKIFDIVEPEFMQSKEEDAKKEDFKLDFEVFNAIGIDFPQPIVDALVKIYTECADLVNKNASFKYIMKRVNDLNIWLHETLSRDFFEYSFGVFEISSIGNGSCDFRLATFLDYDDMEFDVTLSRGDEESKMFIYIDPIDRD